LGGTCPLLALAADDASIHLYSLVFKDVCEIVYNKVYTLTGHEDWVRSMDFISGEAFFQNYTRKPLQRKIFVVLLVYHKNQTFFT